MARTATLKKCYEALEAELNAAIKTEGRKAFLKTDAGSGIHVGNVILSNVDITFISSSKNSLVPGARALLFSGDDFVVYAIGNVSWDGSTDGDLMSFVDGKKVGFTGYISDMLGDLHNNPSMLSSELMMMTACLDIYIASTSSAIKTGNLHISDGKLVRSSS